MTVLHVYDETNSMAAQYVAMLTNAVGTQATMQIATTALSFRMLYDGTQPAIVHLHGKSPFPLPQGIRLVVSPHGSATSDANGAYVVIARSRMEHTTLAQHFARVETILNPIITRATTPEACARQMLQVYLRVMDSNVLPLLNGPTRRLLALILGAATAGDARWVQQYSSGEGYLVSGEWRTPLTTHQTPLTTHQTPLTTHHPSVDFRRLYIYADHENILPLLEEGIRLLNIDAPARQPVESYLPKDYQRPKPMKDADIAGLLADISENGPSLLRLAEIARCLHADDLDEQLLMRGIDERGLHPLFASVLQLLSEQVLLSEGFMPCPPADNAVTERLRTQLSTRHSPLW